MNLRTPDKVNAHAQDRARPAIDLITRVPKRDIKFIHDVGCGPGNSTKLLRVAYAQAQINAIDSSLSMIARARSNCHDAKYTVADVRSWSPNSEADLVFSNAYFHGVPAHEQHLLRIFGAMKSGSVFAVQMPDNGFEPSHQLMPEVAQSFLPAEQVRGIADARAAPLPASAYFDLLSSRSSDIDVWRTTYHHRFAKLRDIAEYFATTALKPWLDAMLPQVKIEFLKNYVRALGQFYPRLGDGGVVYSFPRMFIMAVKA
jgi:trans-aconitate 2-methyltransferase